MKDCVAALDYGTSGVKAAVFGLDGQTLGIASRELPIHLGPNGAALQPIDAVFTAGASALAEAVDRAAVQPEQVRALGITQQRSTFVPVGGDGQPLMDSYILWMDLRGVPYVEQALREGRVCEERFYTIGGLSMRKYVNPWCKILWLRAERPDVYAAASRFESMQTVLLRQLGAVDPPLDRSTASPFGLMDLDRAVWSEELCDCFDLSPRQFSPLASGGTVVGRLAPGPAQRMRLNPGTPLVLGGGDQSCAAIGAGAVHPREVFIGLGTGACVMVGLDRPLRDPRHTVSCIFHAIPGKWEIEGHTQASGVVFKWFRDQFGQAEIAAAGHCDPYDLLTSLATTIPPGADGLLFLPMLNGSTHPEIHPEARGAIVGLGLQHGRGHVVRALIEGVSLEIRWILERIAEIVGGVDRIRLAGGASRSTLWNQINANICNLPVHRAATADAAVLGAAIQAGIGVGLFRDVQTACDAMARVSETYEPEPAVAAHYDEVFGRFMAVYRALLSPGAA